MANKVTLTFGYKDTDFTRKYTLGGVSDTNLNGVKAKVRAINASLAGGTDGGLADFFRSDDFDATTNVGTFNEIKAAQIDSYEEIDLRILE